MRPDQRKEQYTTCKDCTEYAVLDDAETEMKLTTCEYCGTEDVILIADYHIRVGVEIMSK